MKQQVYSVIAYRFADRERHSYLVGIYTKKAQALKAADKEEEHRGGNKYCCEVLEVPMDVQPVIGDGPFKAIKELPKYNWLENRHYIVLPEIKP